MKKILSALTLFLAFGFMAGPLYAADFMSPHSPEWGMSKQQIVTGLSNAGKYTLVENDDNFLVLETTDSDGATAHYMYVFNHSDQLVSVLRTYYPEETASDINQIIKMHDALVADMELVYGESELSNGLVWNVDDATKKQYENNLYQAFKNEYVSKIAGWLFEEGQFIVNITTRAHEGKIATLVAYVNGKYLE